MTLVRETIMLFTTLFEEKRKGSFSFMCLSFTLTFIASVAETGTAQCVVLCWWVSLSRGTQSSRKEMHEAVDHSRGGPRGPTQRRRLDSLPELTVGPLNQCHCECE